MNENDVAANYTPAQLVFDGTVPVWVTREYRLPSMTEVWSVRVGQDQALRLVWADRIRFLCLRCHRPLRLYLRKQAGVMVEGPHARCSACSVGPRGLRWNSVAGPERARGRRLLGQCFEAVLMEHGLDPLSATLAAAALVDARPDLSLPFLKP